MFTVEMMKSMVNVNDLRTTIDYFDGGLASTKALNKMINNWAHNKLHIFELFGGKLKLTAPIEYSYNDRQIENEIYKFKSDEKRQKPYYSLANTFLSTIKTSEITENRLEEDIYILDKKFQAGTRVGRILNQIIPKKYADEYVTDFSMLIQNFKAKGEVVISIDPLDYITMSENSSGWQSCHSLTGCYKTGCFAYMQDPSTVITYVKSSTPVEINDNLIIDNKVWRQIMLISTDNTYAMQLRQYPNSNKNNSQSAAKIVIDLLNNYNDKTNYTRKMYKNNENPVINNLVLEPEGVSTLWYNDLFHDTYQNTFIIAPEDVNNIDDILNFADEYCEVGHEVECLCGCGELLYDSEYLYIEDTEGEYDDDEEWD